MNNVAPVDVGRWRALVLGAVLVALFFHWSRALTEGPVVADAVETVRMGVNLAHHGIVSGNVREPIRPTMYREPVPALTTAIAVRAVDALLGQANPEAYLEGPRARYLKYQNLFWAALMTAGVFGLLLVLTQSFPLALVGAVAANVDLPFYPTPSIDTLMTEPPARALLAVTSFFLAWWARNRSFLVLVLSGLCFGLLALIKAAFLYVFIGLLIALPLVDLLFAQPAEIASSSRSWRKLLAPPALLAVAFAVVTVPWMLRNYVELGRFAISERAGVVMMQRAVLNEMTDEEYVGAFFVFAPHGALQSIVGRVTGFNQRDLEAGGRLQRLNHAPSAFSEADLAAEREGRPDDAVAYHRAARAWRRKMENELRSAGHENVSLVADAQLKQRASSMIRQNTGDHAAYILVALWRGALFSLPILVAGLFYAMRTRRSDVALIVLPPVGLVAVCALATNFELRFSNPVLPITVALTFVLLAAGWRRLRERHQPAARQLREVSVRPSR